MKIAISFSGLAIDIFMVKYVKTEYAAYMQRKVISSVSEQHPSSFQSGMIKVVPSLMKEKVQ
jgi:hypothetical protein